MVSGAFVRLACLPVGCLVTGGAQADQCFDAVVEPVDGVMDIGGWLPAADAPASVEVEPGRTALGPVGRERGSSGAAGPGLRRVLVAGLGVRAA